MSGKSYQTNAQQSSQLFVKIEEFFDKEREPLLSAKKAIGHSAKFLRWGKACAALCPVAGCWKMRLQQKNLPPGGFSGFF